MRRVASQVGLSSLELCPVFRQIGFGLGNLRFVGTRIDHEQPVALPDVSTLLKMDLSEFAANLGRSLMEGRLGIMTAVFESGI